MDFTGMKVWITGGAGFLGQRLTKELQNSGAEVTSISRRKSPISLKSFQINLAGDTDRLKSLVGEHGSPDVLIHTASKQPGSGTFGEFVKSNVLTAANLVDTFRDDPPRQIIYTSTLSVYARPSTLPVNEQHPPVFPSPYSATKRWGEQLFETFKSSQVTVLRLPSLYGAGQADSFIDGLARLALANRPIELFGMGQLVRDALHVSDVTRAVQSCIDQLPSDQFCLMNLGCGRRITTTEYAEALVESLNSKSAIVPVDRLVSLFDCYADISLATRLIGFQPTDLRESMRIYANELRA